MMLYKKILIIIIFIIFIYFISKLLLKRMEIKKEMEGFKEGGIFNFFSSESGEISDAKDTSMDGLNGLLNCTYTNLPLNQLCIKASYNTALTGSYVSNDMIYYVLSRGCRFLDFEIYAVDDIPYVAYSNDPNSLKYSTKNKLLLSSVLSFISQHAFMSPCPNPHDPLFINFRIKTSSQKLYENIAMALDVNIKRRLYQGNVSGYTPLSNLLGKVVLIIDRLVAPDYMKYPDCTSVVGQCYNILNYSNMESNGKGLRVYGYNNLLDQKTFPPNINDDGITTNDNNFKMVIPDGINTLFGIVKNPEVNPIILNYGIQICCYRFYQKDTNLLGYEQIFSDNKAAIVPMAIMIKYLSKQ